MEEPTIEDTNGDEGKPTPGNLTLVRGFLLIVGGALLGFFGCEGGLYADSLIAALVMLGLGVLVVFWGIVMVLFGLDGSMTKS